MSPTPDEVAAGHAFYTKRSLAVYDAAILGFFSRVAWRCPAPRILEHYDAHVSADHLDIGVGTGYFLDRCRFPSSTPRVALMDPNEDCLAVAARRIDRYHPESYVADVLAPVEIDAKPFDSVGMNYLLHCLPGSIAAKATVFENLKAVTNPGAVVFGATLLSGGVRRSWFARRVMERNNAHGIFSNADDDLDGLRIALDEHLDEPGIRVVGCVAIFAGRVRAGARSRVRGSNTYAPSLRISRPEVLMGALDGKVIAITGAGRGIGRATAEFCASEGASVVVNDYGVSIDGNEPTSEVADEVVDAIRTAGGQAVANASSVTTMEGGASIVQSAIDAFGRIDGVVTVAGILRERMFFNMVEEEWDPVIETHLKGTFTVFRAAAPFFKEQKSGSFVAFTSGAFAGSVAQANYASAKGAIVSLARSVAAGMYKYGVRANVIAPVAKSRMSGNVPFGIEMGEPEDVAPMVGFLLSDRSQDVTGQIYTANGGKIAVWNQPVEVREMRTDGRWTIDGIAERFSEVGQEELGLIKVLAEREAAAKAAKESGTTPNQ